MEHDTFSSSLEFPEWHHLYRAAVMETDREKLKERVTDAENAIFIRLQSLASFDDHHAERHAIQDALSALRTLKRERLRFPDWK